MTKQTFFVFRMPNNLMFVINDFFFRPASSLPLAVFRIGLASILMVQALAMYKSFLNFFANTGFVQGEVSGMISDPSLPRLNWLCDFFSLMGLNESISLTIVGLLYVASLLFLLCGVFTRWAAFFSWFLHWSLMNTGYSGAYGADMYAHIFLFYLILFPSNEAFAMDRLFYGISKEPSYQARLGIRIIQIHMCVSYLASGLEKATGAQWWNGEIIWRALNTPGYSTLDFHWLAQVPFLPMVLGWIVLAIEIFYCVMIWPKKTRPFWIAATCILHLGIATFLNLKIFGILMCIPTFALFAISSEPRLEKRTAKNNQPLGDSVTN